jgi:imidazolonepropionase-like amidohydrolase
MELLVEAGMSTVDVLRATTSLPAKCFGLEDRGVIEAGERADLVLLQEDPLIDIRATRSLKRIWCGGVEVWPALS